MTTTTTDTTVDTSVDTNVDSTQTEGTPAPAPEVQKRTTLKSALFAGEVQSLTELLLKMTDNDKDAIKELGKTFASAVKSVPTVLIELQKKEEEAKIKADAERALAEAKAKEEAEEALKVLEEKKAKLVQSMMELGIPECVAVAQADIALKQEAVSRKGNRQYSRVAVIVEGKEYDMPVRGNMNTELKVLVKASGLDRDAFIEKYKKVEAQTESTEE